MKHLICDKCSAQATYRLVMINRMKAKIGQQTAYLLCDNHSKGLVVLNYQLSKINED